MSYNNWRDDPGLTRRVIYKKRFAFKPVICHDGVKVWFKNYYTKYHTWGDEYYTDNDNKYFRCDTVEHITEAEFIIRKLAESL